ncbi:MAG: radical SAM protein [Desulfovibrionaceae bacterium]|nr:radical SAM protein [Desulfovibrionaceae bacterium]MBF0514702.1 radical SAM protein [Desulfovibrionaceae bacterium]
MLPVDVYFINPPYRSKNIHVYLPMGMAYVVHAMALGGLNVRVLDMNLDQTEIEEAVATVVDSRAPMVAITGFLTQWGTIVRLVRQLKIASPNIKIMLGGSLLNGAERFLFDECPVDVIVRGDGEVVAVEVAKCILQGLPIPEIPGVAYRDGDQIISYPGVAKIKDIDRIPMLNRDFFDVERYIGRYFNSTLGTRTLEVVWSRGCPYGCVYCINSKNDGRYRLRSVDNVIKEIIFLKEQYNIDDIVFASEVFTVKRDRVMDLCERLKPLCITWTAVTRADLLDEELVAAMADAGCRWVFVGIEAADNELLKKMNKKITIERISEAIFLIKKYKMEPRGGFIVGLPWETPETIAKARDFCIKHGLIYWPSFATAYPNTTLYEYARPKIADEKAYLYSITDHHQFKTLLINLTNMSNKSLIGFKNDASAASIAEYIHKEKSWIHRSFIKLGAKIMLTLYHSEEFLGIDIHSLMHKVLRAAYLALNLKFRDISRLRRTTSSQIPKKD